MSICDYGCGKEAIFFFKNNKGCCSSNVNACDGKRLKDSVNKKGKIPKWKTCSHPRGRKGKPAWNKGKTNIELYGEEKTKQIKETTSNKLKGNKNWSKVSPEVLERIKKQASERAYKRHADGWQGSIGRCKKINYISHIAGEVVLDGGWELIVAKYFDHCKINWRRNKKRFKYLFENKVRYYLPDFYLPDENLYIEVKGYETELDIAKWSQFTEKLEVWKKEKIFEIKKHKLEV